jgi:hypothetical protein
MHPRTRNVTRIFRQATPDQLAAGRDWYARARRLAEELAYRLPESHRHHGDVERAAAVIAVLSPRVSWPLNVRLARQAYSLAAVNSQASQYAPNLRGALPANSWKAARLLATAEPTGSIVRGPKVTAFWFTIANPWSAEAVVIDRHAVDVTLNRTTDDATRGMIIGRKGGYAMVAEVYRRAARILSRESGEAITPAEVQAVTWLVWRETRALANHGNV